MTYKGNGSVIFPIMKLNFGILILLLAATSLRAQDSDLSKLLQQGLLDEQANHNLDAAIGDYKAVAAQFDKDRQIAATAIFRLGECYRAQGKNDEAAAQYERILKDFSDQQTLVTLSRQNLTGMGVSVASASPGEAPGVANTAPAETPATDDEDKEIERLKKFLKDTPDLLNATNGLPPPLLEAVSSNQLRVTKFLLDNHADVNLVYNNQTPLMTAVTENNRDMIELLLKYGADINAKDSSGKTALEAAVDEQRPTMVDTLLAHHPERQYAWRPGRLSARQRR